MKAKVGDIVLYKTEDPGGYVYPAVIVAVHQTSVDLEVFTVVALDRQQRYVEYGIDGEGQPTEMHWCERGT